jgi:hypothetical protein
MCSCLSPECLVMWRRSVEKFFYADGEMAVDRLRNAMRVS